MIEIVKNQLDVGLLTERAEVVDFWRDEVGLRLDHVLPVARGHDQHRFDLAGSVIKLNLLPLPGLPETRRSGLVELLIARPGVQAPRPMVDPDGNRVRLVPPGHEGVTQMGVRLRVRNAVRGWAYWTVQVRDCDAEVARVEALGASIVTRPRNLGEVARMAMVGDPDGNPLEISQRASLTGPLPEPAPLA